MTRLMLRAYSGKALIFQEKVEAEEDADLRPLISKQLDQIMVFPKHMIEIEFLDEPNVNLRFFRFGTTPEGMVNPILTKDLLKFLRQRKP